MVFIRSAKLVLILSVILLNLKEYCCTRTSQGIETSRSGDGNLLTRSKTTIGSSTTEKEFYHGVPAVAETESSMLRGRTTLLTTFLKSKIRREENLHEEALRFSSAVHSISNLKHKGKRKSKVERKLRNRHRGHRVKLDADSFMAFSADYHVPNHHPPRHN